jgi:hypothetical protein
VQIEEEGREAFRMLPCSPTDNPAGGTALAPQHVVLVDSKLRESPPNILLILCIALQTPTSPSHLAPLCSTVKQTDERGITIPSAHGESRAALLPLVQLTDAFPFTALPMWET